MIPPQSTIRGFGLIEVLVGASIISLALAGVVFLGGSYEKLSRRARAAVQVEFLLTEGMEGLRSMRDDGWQRVAELASDTPYAILFENGVYTATSSPLMIDGIYSRAITLSPVYRDSDFRIIVSEGGVLDTETKEVTVSVSWMDNGATTTRSIKTYLVNLFE